MLIIITGTPGTGKTEISKELGKLLGVEVLEIKKIVEKNKNRIFTKNRAGEKIVDIVKLRTILLKTIKTRKTAIIDSHILCEFDLPANFVFVLRTEPKELRKRLEKRKYAKKKIDENILCEMLDYCLLKTELNYKCRILQTDTTKTTPQAAAQRIALAIKHKKKSLDSVDHSNRLLKTLVS